MCDRLSAQNSKISVMYCWATTGSGQARLAAGLWDAAETRIVAEQTIAGVQCFFLEGWAVTGKEQPVGDFLAQQFDGMKRGELAAEGRVDGFGEDEPDAIVLWRLGVVAQHADDAVAQINSISGNHGPDLGFEGRERVENKSVRRLFARGFDDRARAGHAASGYPGMPVWATAQRLVDKVADVGEETLAQFHTQQSRVERDAELRLKNFEDVTREVGLLPKQAQQRRAIHWAFVVTGYP